jgi:hypothetical protein
MSPDNSNNKDIWLPVKVRGLVTVVGLIVCVGGLSGLTFFRRVAE